MLKTLHPDAITAITNMAGSVTDIDEAVDSHDAAWVNTSSHANSACTVSFPSPGGNLATGAGKQKFRVYLKSTSLTTRTFSFAVYEGASSKASSGTINVPSSSEGVYEWTWDASVLTDVSGEDVRCRISQNDGYINIGAVEWVADVAGVSLTASDLASSSPSFDTPEIVAGYQFTAAFAPHSPIFESITDFGQHHILGAASLTVSAPTFSLPGASSLSVPDFTVAAPGFDAPSIRVAYGPWTQQPSQSAQISEAEEVLGRAVDELVAAVPGKTTGRLSWDFRRAIGYLRTYGEDLIVDGKLGPYVESAWDLARQAGATFEMFETARREMIKETPVSVPAQAVVHLTVRLTLVQMARITAATQFVSREDAAAALTRIAAAFDPAEEDAADERDASAYRALVSLRAAAVRDLAERGRRLPHVVPYRFADARPVLWLANRIYADASRCDELRLENKIIHPAFAPPEGICLSR